MIRSKTIAIIPARSGSERLPQKNTKLLGGISLLAHSILYAQENGIENIVVTTNDSESKEIALKFGAQVIDRPDELATSTSPTIDALIHTIEHIEEDYETVVLLQPTNPLRPKNLLSKALKTFSQGGFDSLMTVSRNHQKFGKVRNDVFEPYNYTFGQRSQDLEPLYFENGLLYITKSSLIRGRKILGANNHPYIVNHPFANVDIDTQEDFDYAEYIYNKYK